MAFDHASKRWNGAPAIHVAIYGRGRPGRPWMAFEVPPYVVERLSKPYVKPKTIRIDRDRIYVTYERVHDREPVDWAGVDMNAGNNTYACADGRIMGSAKRPCPAIQPGMQQYTEGETPGRTDES